MQNCWKVILALNILSPDEVFWLELFNCEVIVSVLLFHTTNNKEMLHMNV